MNADCGPCGISTNTKDTGFDKGTGAANEQESDCATSGIFADNNQERIMNCGFPLVVLGERNSRLRGHNPQRMLDATGRLTAYHAGSGQPREAVGKPETRGQWRIVEDIGSYRRQRGEP